MVTLVPRGGHVDAANGPATASGRCGGNGPGCGCWPHSPRQSRDIASDALFLRAEGGPVLKPSSVCCMRFVSSPVLADCTIVPGGGGIRGNGVHWGVETRRM